MLYPIEKEIQQMCYMREVVVEFPCEPKPTPRWSHQWHFTCVRRLPRQTSQWFVFSRLTKSGKSRDEPFLGMAQKAASVGRILQISFAFCRPISGHVWNPEKKIGDFMTEVFSDTIRNQDLKKDQKHLDGVYSYQGAWRRYRGAGTGIQRIAPDGILLVVGTPAQVHQYFRQDGSVTWNPDSIDPPGLTVSAECGAHPFRIAQAAHGIRNGRATPSFSARRQIYSNFQKRVLVVHVGNDNSPLRRSRSTNSSTLTYEDIRNMTRSLLFGIDAMAWSKASRALPTRPI